MKFRASDVKVMFIIITCIRTIIGASLSEPLLDELAGAFLWYIYIFNKMKKEVGMLLQKTTDTRAVGIYNLYEENTH